VVTTTFSFGVAVAGNLVPAQHYGPVVSRTKSLLVIGVGVSVLPLPAAPASCGFERDQSEIAQIRTCRAAAVVHAPFIRSHSSCLYAVAPVVLMTGEPWGYVRRDLGSGHK
jgi:hypothetical protein